MSSSRAVNVVSVTAERANQFFDDEREGGGEGGGILEIRFRNRYRRLYNSIEEDQTMIILQDQFVGNPMFSLLRIPTHALTSPLLIEQYLLPVPACHHVRDSLARLVSFEAARLLMNWNRCRRDRVNVYCGTIHLFAEVEFVITDVVTNQAEVEVEAEVEERVPFTGTGASDKALAKLEREEEEEGLEGVCVVCLDELVSSEITRMPCNHVFHSLCLLQWLKNTDTCPICRRKLPE